MKLYLRIILLFLMIINFQILFSQDTLLSDLISSETNIIKIKSLIDQGIDVNSKNRFQMSPLEVASKSGNMEIIKLLISHGARINEKMANDRTALMYALSDGNNYELVEYLLQNGAEVNVKDKSGVPAIFYLYLSDQPIFGTRVNFIKLLENYGANLKITNIDSSTILYKMVSSCDLPSARYLISEKEFDISSTNFQQKTIYDKIAKCNLDMLQYLLSLKPVNLNFRNIFLNAAVANNFQIISYLIDTLKVIKINEQDKFNRNALMFAYDNTNDETINYLLKKGIDINAKDTFGVNVFMRVCYICNMNLMKKLVNQKVKINAEDNDKWTAIDYAEASYMMNKTEAISYLQSIHVKNGKDKKSKPIFKKQE